MSTFTCKCGAVTRECEEAQGTSGVLYAHDAMIAVEKSIADQVAAFLKAGEAREAWITTYFGIEYSPDLPDREIIEDIVSRELLCCEWTSVFRCTICGRIALGPEDPSASWRFFFRDEAI
jgi:hypothetical protein